MITLPDKLEIGGFAYSIEIATEELENKGCFGDCSGYFKRIRVKGNLSEQELGNTLLHEALHCIDYVYLAELLDEKVLAVLANGLYQVLKQLGFTINYQEQSNDKPNNP